MTDYSEQNNKKENNKNTDLRTGYFIFTQFLLEVIFFVGIAVLLGLYLDRVLNTKFIFLLVFILLFGFVPIYNLVKRFLIFEKENNK